MMKIFIPGTTQHLIPRYEHEGCFMNMGRKGGGLNETTLQWTIYYMQVALNVGQVHNWYP